MTREEAKELLPLYAVEALDGEEAIALEAFLRDASADMQHELRAWREVVAMIPLALPEVVPPPSLRTQLFDRISVPEYIDLPEPNADPFIEPVIELASKHAAAPPASATSVEETTAKVLSFALPARRRFGVETQRWMLLAATVLLALSSVYLYRENSYIESDRNIMQAKLQSVESENASLLASLNEATRVLSMKGVETPDANAKVIWDTKENAWRVFVYRLPAPASDKQYQLWFVTKTQKVSAKVFSTDERGQSVLNFIVPPDVVKGLAATAVTLEPKGGSPQPTGKFYLSASI